MKHLNWISLAVGIIALALAAYVLTDSLGNKSAYIDLRTVFDDFEMTKQYKKKLESVVSARKAIADSLELNLKAQSRSINSGSNASDEKVQDFVFNKEYYIERVKQFQEDNMALKQQYDGEINKQISQYVKDYGEKNGYRFIYGADGSGVLMYAKEGDNITKQVTEYINSRFNGQGK